MDFIGWDTCLRILSSRKFEVIDLESRATYSIEGVEDCRETSGKIVFHLSVRGTTQKKIVSFPDYFSLYYDYGNAKKFLIQSGDVNFYEVKPA